MQTVLIKTCPKVRRTKVPSCSGTRNPRKFAKHLFKKFDAHRSARRNIFL